MKVVKFNGGLGNQMFQYAFGLALEHHFNEEIYYDISNYNEHDKNSTRPFLINKYNTHLKIANRRQRKRCKNENSRFKNYVNTILKKDIFVEKSNLRTEKNETNFQENLFLPQDNIYYEGFFQTERYFEKYKNEILTNFELKEKIPIEVIELINKTKNTTSISLHVRRTDYNTGSLYYCDLDYYNSAIKYIASKFNNPHFYIFSDDFKWVDENLKLDFPKINVNINNDMTSYLDIEIMKNCKHHINSNSTFCWWGAYLNKSPQKIVIVPKNRFKNYPEYDSYPQDWIKI